MTSWQDTWADLFVELDSAKERAKSNFLKSLGSPAVVPINQVPLLADRMTAAACQALLNHIGPISTDESVLIDAIRVDGIKKLNLRVAPRPVNFEMIDRSPLDTVMATTANLIVNGSFETDELAPWVVSLEEPLVRPAILQFSDPGPDIGLSGYAPSDGGSRFLMGGGARNDSSIKQVIDLSAYADQIDTGICTGFAEGWFGGWGDQNDRAQLSCSFRDADGVLLGAVIAGPVTNVERSNTTTLLYRSSLEAVPVGTRSVRCVVYSTYDTGGFNNGYADDLKFKLDYPTEIGLARPVPTLLWQVDDVTTPTKVVALWLKYGVAATAWAKVWPVTETFTEISIASNALAGFGSMRTLLVSGAGPLNGIDSDGVADGETVTLVRKSGEGDLQIAHSATTSYTPIKGPSTATGYISPLVPEEEEVRLRLHLNGSGAPYWKYIGGSAT